MQSHGVKWTFLFLGSFTKICSGIFLNCEIKHAVAWYKMDIF
jgi:hypothetical protein